MKRHRLHVDRQKQSHRSGYFNGNLRHQHFSTRHDRRGDRSLERCSGQIFNFTPRSNLEKESQERLISF